MTRTAIILALTLFTSSAYAQVRINEASSRNFRAIADENGEYHDWVELFNASNEWVNLEGYTLTDDILVPAKWTFPAMGIAPQGYLVVFCSGYDRMPRAGQTTVAVVQNYTPVAGWNTHVFGSPFTWDGVSNIVIELCAVNTVSTSLNASLNQTTTPFASTTYTFTDSVSTACGQTIGNVTHRRPVIQLNGHAIGTSDWQNNSIQYPAPYGNWAGGSKHAMLFRASELLAAGVMAGDISSLAFDVVQPNGGYFSEIDIRLGHVPENEAKAEFIPWYGAYQFHTNFGLARGGESVLLFSPRNNW